MIKEALAKKKREAAKKELERKRKIKEALEKKKREKAEKIRKLLAKAKAAEVLRKHKLDLKNKLHKSQIKAAACKTMKHTAYNAYTKKHMKEHNPESKNMVHSVKAHIKAGLAAITKTKLTKKSLIKQIAKKLKNKAAAIKIV